MPPVVVIGAGICGASCALALHDAGRDVLVLDQARAPSLGATGKGEGNVLRGDATGGREAWQALAERFPRAVKLREKGSLTLFEGDGARELAARLGGDAEVVDDPRSLEPALRPGLAPAVFVPSDCQVDPHATVLAMLEGIPFRPNSMVTAYDAHSVAVGHERLDAEAVVLCTGAWATEPDVRPRKGQLVALGPAPGLIRRKLIDAAYPAAVASVIEEAVTGEVYVGSSRADIGFAEGVDEALNQTMLERAAGWVPAALADLTVVRSWWGFRPYRPGGPFVGRLESGVWACVGHEGAGVGLGPVDGRRLADMLPSESLA